MLKQGPAHNCQTGIMVFDCYSCHMSMAGIIACEGAFTVSWSNKLNADEAPDGNSAFAHVMKGLKKQTNLLIFDSHVYTYAKFMGPTPPLMLPSRAPQNPETQTSQGHIPLNAWLEINTETHEQQQFTAEFVITKFDESKRWYLTMSYLWHKDKSRIPTLPLPTGWYPSHTELQPWQKTSSKAWARGCREIDIETASFIEKLMVPHYLSTWCAATYVKNEEFNIQVNR